MSEPHRSAVRRLATARLISITGGVAAFLALVYTVYERTGSAGWLAASLLVTFGAQGFAGPFAGLVGDRFDRRRVMIGAELTAAGAFLAMALLARGHPGPLLALAFCAAVAETPFLAASTAAIPNLVPERELGWANGMVALGRNAGVLLGPLVGGAVLAGLGPGTVFALNAATFVASALLTATVRGRFGGGGAGDDEVGGLRDGFAFLLGDRVLRTLVLAWLALVVGLGMTMVADVPLVRLFGTGSWGYGVLISSWGLGSILGSLLGRRLDASREPVALVAGAAVAAVTCASVGVSPWFALVLVAITAAGVGDAVAIVAQQGMLQRRTPDRVRGRVSGAFESVAHAGLAASYLVGGLAVSGLGVRAVYLLAGACALAAGLVAVPVLRAGIGAPPATAAPPEEAIAPEPPIWAPD